MIHCLKTLTTLMLLHSIEADEHLIQRAIRNHEILDYVLAFEILPFYEARVRKLSRLGVKRDLRWTYELDYSAGCIEKRLVDLDRELEVDVR